MKQIGLRAVFMRGGTSKAVMFRAEDLPRDRAQWAPIFLGVVGSPDANGRQLDGMGGGVSSLSKVCVIGASTRAEADVDYTFAQVSVTGAAVDYSGNCGNMSSAVGPFAVDEGLVKAVGNEAIVRIHNTNTQKIIVAHFGVDDGHAAVEGDFVLPGVAGTGAPIRLDFLDPGGAGTGRLLPTGNVADQLEIAGAGMVEASMVDAANPCVFVLAEALGMTGIEMPDALDANRDLLDRLEAIRIAASLRMGIARTAAEAASKPSIPKVAMVTGPRAARTLAGDRIAAEAADLTVRMISIGQPHRAVPLTGAMCLAVASRLPGSVAHRVARAPASSDQPVRIAQPSGLTVVGAAVRGSADGWIADQATVYRTARRLMEGVVFVRASAFPR
ncbi:MAG: PrpF domain-containing protein [Candidatus Binataceae bacterium]|jgi:2-methylaconitate cis-trans-isomerase PrpF